MRAGTILFCTLITAWIAMVGSAAVTPKSELRNPKSSEAADFFEARVRPVLAENCFSCHGPQMQMAGLRLDSRASALKGSDRGPVLVPGEPEKSALIKAIRYDGAVKMPPTGKLKPEQIEALTAWVKMGAPWPAASGTAAATPAPGGIFKSEEQRTHWAFQPVRVPKLPAVKNAAWANSPIDRFVLAKLEQKGLAPSPPADRRTLIRRAYFDLTGLPPTAAEVAAFIADRSPDAFAKVVDRLLASPRYGERWGRYWLDVARYADTKGYVFNEERRYPFAYTYRDYVIDAFNHDLPYDRFLTEQIAADKLSLGTDKRPLAAMGFLTLGRRFLNNTADIIDDRIDVVARGTMALTVGCARCHDHKFDPIPTADYYSLYGVFASSREPADLPMIGAPEHSAAYEAWEKSLKAAQEAADRYVAGKRTEALSRVRAATADYLMAADESRKRTDPEQRRTFARDRNVNPLVLTRWESFLTETRKHPDALFSPWHAFAALPDKEFAAQAPALAAKFAANADPKSPLDPAVAKLFAGPPPTSLREVAQRYATLCQDTEPAFHPQIPQISADESKNSLSNLRQSAKSADKVGPEIRNPKLHEALTGPNGPLNIPEAETERLLNRAERDALTRLRSKVDQVRASPDAPPHAMVLEDMPAPVTPHILIRGNVNNPGAEVPRRFLRLLAGENPPPFQGGSGRLELAEAIASKQNPLTARVMVNRVWLHHFGAGLVRTPSDFGMRGEPPTHPELLDYLATKFMEDGWSIKKLHRAIMLSRTYQQSSGDTARGLSLDPENRLLWKMSRRRLDLEATRDALLAAAGQLDPAIGGPAVEITTAPFSRRRTLYGFIDRQNLQGLFRTFDFATPDSTSPQRFTTTVPQQALFMMNSPFVIEQARALVARREVTAPSAPEERIRELYRIVYSRSPTPEEVQLGVRFLAAAASEEPSASPPATSAAAPQPPSAPHGVVPVAVVSPPPPAANHSLSPWERYAQVLLLANEFVFVD